MDFISLSVYIFSYSQYFRVFIDTWWAGLTRWWWGAEEEEGGGSSDRQAV